MLVNYAYRKSSMFIDLATCGGLGVTYKVKDNKLSDLEKTRKVVYDQVVERLEIK